MDIHDLFNSCLVETVAQNKATPIIFHSEQTVNELLEELSNSHISSAPVLDLGTNEPLGFVDTLDLAHFLLEGTKRGDITNRTEFFGKQKVSMIFDSSKRNSFVPIKMNSTLLAAANIFKQGVHRIPVMNEKNEIVSIISQSDVIYFLYENKDKLGTSFNVKLKDMGEEVIHKIICTSKQARTMDAYGLFFSQGVNALAVVDDKGVLVGNLSPTDLKGLHGRSVENLLDPVEIFLRTSRIRQKQKQDFVAYVDVNATMMDVLNIIVSQHIHRVWIVDDNIKPIGLVSLTDIIWKVLKAK